MIDVLLITLIATEVASGIARSLRHWRPHWSLRRTAIAAASPLPAMLAALCGFIFVRAAMAPPEACGVDACGIAMMSSIFGFGIAIMVLLAGLVPVALIKRRSPQR